VTGKPNEAITLEFADRQAWRAWLEKNNGKAAQAWLVIQKKGSDKSGLTLDSAVEEALCFGWIDGHLKPIDRNSYRLRFSPRRASSVWSIRNIRRVEALLRAGVVEGPGMVAIEAAKHDGRWQAAFERANVEAIPSDLRLAPQNAKGALSAYRGLPTSKKEQMVYWIESAKRPVTRRRRIEAVVRQVSELAIGGSDK
jgi:uncharacterized protein YdeI (YjbR/CyaY-like superfamily)